MKKFLILVIFLSIVGSGCSDDDSKTTPCDPNPCTLSHKTVCTVDGDKFHCECESGYVESGYICVEDTNPTCDPDCQEWETCVNTTCILSQGRCNSDSDCSQDMVCNDQHSCEEGVNLCNPNPCETWEDCNEGNCSLSQGRCVNDSDCQSPDTCDQTYHRCEAPSNDENTNEKCSDNIDNDNNGYKDCDDFSCTYEPSVTVCGIQENSNEKCSDGEDNDGNGYVDCRDFSCSRNPNVTVCGDPENTNELCNDWIDNDGNGFTDCEDYSCSRNPDVTVCSLTPCDPNPCTGTNKTSCGVIDPEHYTCYCDPGYEPSGNSCVQGGWGSLYDNLGDSTDTELIEKLYNLVKNHTSIGYDSAKSRIFGWDGGICAYTGESGASSCEHVWPQSYFGEASPMKSDMHHLFTVTNYVNSKRGNIHFGNVVKTDCPCETPDEPWYCDWDGSGSGAKKGKPSSRCEDYSVFEPRDDKKGDVARALFYFAVRYKDDQINQSQAGGTGPHPANHIPPYEEIVLKRWHHMDPVDADEMERNDRVYGVQGNRNPFIDRPDLVDRISDF